MAPLTAAKVTDPVKVAVKKKKGPRVDNRPHVLRSIFFFGIFLAVFGWVKVFTLESRDGKPAHGFRFHPELNGWVVPEVLYGIPLAYIAFVLIMTRLMQDAKPLDGLVGFIQPFYNVTQIVVCSYMVYGLLPNIGVWNGKMIFGMNEKFTKDIEYFVFIHYLTKYLDWCDTLFMIFRKKFNQISFLHVFHHATIGVVWGFLLSEGVGSGTAAFGAWMNSLTHVIMYTHYLVTSFGINNPFKKYITRWQLFQFATCLTHSFVILSTSYDKVLMKEYAWMQVMYQSFMLMLFGLYMNWVPAWLVGIDVPPKSEKAKTN